MPSSKRTAEREIAKHCDSFIASPREIDELLRTNPAGGGFMSGEEFLKEEKSFRERGIDTIIALGPLSSVNTNIDGSKLKALKEKLAHSKMETWTYLITNIDEQYREIHKFLEDHENMLSELPLGNIEQRAYHLFAILALYPIIHLHNYRKDFQNKAIVIFLPDNPISGFEKYEKKPPDHSTSVNEVRMVLELRKRGYPLPPIYMVYGVLGKPRQVERK